MNTAKVYWRAVAVAFGCMAALPWVSVFVGDPYWQTIGALLLGILFGIGALNVYDWRRLRR